jgi:hypothetical protein
MKILFSVLFFCAIVSLAACTQKLDASKVPGPVKDAFAKQFPSASATWEKEDGNYEAGFESREHKMSALFDANGNMSESEIEIKAAELPAAVTEYIQTNYKGYSIKEAAKITRANGEINYEAEVNGKDLLFDINGKFIK